MSRHKYDNILNAYVSIGYAMTTARVLGCVVVHVLDTKEEDSMDPVSRRCLKMVLTLILRGPGSVFAVLWTV